MDWCWWMWMRLDSRHGLKLRTTLDSVLIGGGGVDGRGFRGLHSLSDPHSSSQSTWELKQPQR